MKTYTIDFDFNVGDIVTLVVGLKPFATPYLARFVVVEQVAFFDRNGSCTCKYVCRGCNGKGQPFEGEFFEEELSLYPDVKDFSLDEFLRQEKWIRNDGKFNET